MIEKKTYGDVVLYSTSVEAVAACGSRRAAEKEAVARLVVEAFGKDAVLGHYDDGAPYIEGHEDVYVSVSHSRRVAVFAVAEVPVGVDVEEYRAQLERVAHRFLSDREYSYYRTPEGLLKAWTLKEAAYKALRPQGAATTLPLPPQPVDYQIIFSDYLPQLEDTYLSIVVTQPRQQQQ